MGNVFFFFLKNPWNYPWIFSNLIRICIFFLMMLLFRRLACCLLMAGGRSPRGWSPPLNLYLFLWAKRRRPGLKLIAAACWACREQQQGTSPRGSGSQRPSHSNSHRVPQHPAPGLLLYLYLPRLSPTSCTCIHTQTMRNSPHITYSIALHPPLNPTANLISLSRYHKSLVKEILQNKFIFINGNKFKIYNLFHQYSYDSLLE